MTGQTAGDGQGGEHASRQDSIDIRLLMRGDMSPTDDTPRKLTNDPIVALGSPQTDDNRSSATMPMPNGSSTANLNTGSQQQPAPPAQNSAPAGTQPEAPPVLRAVPSGRGLQRVLTLEVPPGPDQPPPSFGMGLNISPTAMNLVSPTDAMLAQMLSPSDFMQMSPLDAAAARDMSGENVPGRRGFTAPANNTQPKGSSQPAAAGSAPQPQPTFDGEVEVMLIGLGSPIMCVSPGSKIIGGGSNNNPNNPNSSVSPESGAATSQDTRSMQGGTPPQARALRDTVNDLSTRLNSSALLEETLSREMQSMEPAYQDYVKSVMMNAPMGAMPPPPPVPPAAAPSPFGGNGPIPSVVASTAQAMGSAPMQAPMQAVLAGMGSSTRPTLGPVDAMRPRPLEVMPADLLDPEEVHQINPYTGAIGSTYDSLISPLPEPPRKLSFSKRDRCTVLDLTFEAYEKKYNLKAARCPSGNCFEHCSMPCELHTCKCCKKNRQMDVEGVQKHRKYCGPCMRREKVDGLDFVKCGFLTIVDGVEQICGVEMLREVFDNHWKQHRSELAPVSIDVPTRQGRKCGTCTNMRPITYYAKKDSNCSCTHCQLRKTDSKAEGTGDADARMRAAMLRRATQISSAEIHTPPPADLSDVGDESTVRHVRRASFPGMGAMPPTLLPHSASMGHASMPGSTVKMSMDGAEASSSQAMPHQGAPDNFNSGGAGPSRDPNTGLSPWNSASAPNSQRTLWQSQSVVSDSASLASLENTVLYQAQNLPSTILGAAVSSCPTFRLLLGKWHEARAQPTPAPTGVQGALTGLLRALQTVEREAQNIVQSCPPEELQSLLAHGNNLLNASQPIP